MSKHESPSVAYLIFDWTRDIKVEILYKEIHMKFKTKYLLCERHATLAHCCLWQVTQYFCVGQKLTETSGDSFYGEAVNKLSLVWMSTSVKLKSVGCRFSITAQSVGCHAGNLPTKRMCDGACATQILFAESNFHFEMCFFIWGSASDQFLMPWVLVLESLVCCCACLGECSSLFLPLCVCLSGNGSLIAGRWRKATF